jgi:hypothetical protein
MAKDKPAQPEPFDPKDRDKWPTDPIVQALLGSEEKVPDGPVDHVVLVGYRGAGDTTGDLCRLYVDLDFCAFYVIKTRDIKFHTRDKEDGPSRVYLTADADVEFRVVGQASFVSGAIATAYLGVARAAAASSRGGQFYAGDGARQFGAAGGVGAVAGNPCIACADLTICLLASAAVACCQTGAKTCVPNQTRC